MCGVCVRVCACVCACACVRGVLDGQNPQGADPRVDPALKKIHGAVPGYGQGGDTLEESRFRDGDCFARSSVVRDL